MTLWDQAKLHHSKNLPFVLYKRPRESYVNGVFQNDDELNRVADFTEQGFIFSPFNAEDQPPVLIKFDVVLQGTFDVDRSKTICEPINDHSNDLEFVRYLEMVDKAVSVINSNKIKKVVLSRSLEVNVTKSNFDIFNDIIQIYDNAFCYLWHHPGVGTWMGATPEVLLKCNGNRFTTMALAGTQVVKENSCNPKWGDKELYEQQLVTDYIVAVLEPQVQNITVGEVESSKAGNLWHLRTKISGIFQKEHFGKLIKSLHPTPAVCGIPLQASKDFILKNENYKRSFYTGYLGELNLLKELSRNKNPRNNENSVYKSVTNTSELFVNLRCIQRIGNKAIIYVGGGITQGSDAKKEWVETVNKSFTMLRILKGI
ncbi:chorismate-binding protein [Maribacter sp. CXY002]|uniref:chorismate-binding protein n=1 Tax=Maribacter luteocoastalis TaxID=3407671 RepID=UPI003B683AB6